MAHFGYQVAGFGAGAVREQDPQEITVDAIDFNGTTSSIKYANSIFSDVNFKYGDALPQEMTISFWCKLNSIDNEVTDYIWDINDNNGTENTESRCYFTTNSLGDIRWGFFYSTNLTNTNSNYIGFLTNSGHISTGTWQHFVISIQYASGGAKTVKARIDGSDVLSGITPSTDDLSTSGYDAADTWIGVDQSYGTLGGPNEYGDTFADMCLTQFFINDKFYDIDQTQEIRKFYSVNSKPVQTPANPLVYLEGTSTTWANSGSTSLGTQTLSNITNCADSPSD